MGQGQLEEERAAVRACEEQKRGFEVQLKDGADREEALKAEVKKCQDFMLRISEEYFRLGLQQATLCSDHVKVMIILMSNEA